MRLSWEKQTQKITLACGKKKHVRRYIHIYVANHIEPSLSISSLSLLLDVVAVISIHNKDNHKNVLYHVVVSILLAMYGDGRTVGLFLCIHDPHGHFEHTWDRRKKNVEPP